MLVAQASQSNERITKRNDVKRKQSSLKQYHRSTKLHEPNHEQHEILLMAFRGSSCDMKVCSCSYLYHGR